MMKDSTLKRCSGLAVGVLCVLAIVRLSADGGGEEVDPVLEAKIHMPAEVPELKEGQEEAIFGAGCFWCIEAVYEQIEGVESAVSGYAGGHTENPTYQEVITGRTGHAEVVRLVFDPEKISFAELLDWFWKMHDPTTLNRQGNDVGTQYRSAIFYTSEEQMKTALASKEEAQKNFDDPIVTEITKADTFYPAENYHQEYYRRVRGENPYNTGVIKPKLKELGLEH